MGVTKQRRNRIEIQPKRWTPGLSCESDYEAGTRHQVTVSEMRELIIDNFAGGGGASTGIALALGRSVDIAINHDPSAIAMHQTNHPDTKHYCESVWDIDPLKVTNRLPVGLAWFSPDCKHFSKAKGSKPVSKHIRGLAWVVLKWAALVRPRVCMLENVEEFVTWGPLDDQCYPLKDRAGETFGAFISCLTTGLRSNHPAWAEIREAIGDDFPYEMLERGLGYSVQWRELRACDYGAPTIRKRFFLVARCDGRPITWPTPTHGDPKNAAVKSGKLLPWRTAAEIIDWSLPCPSIFEREKPLAENTMRRIARGIWKFVINNPEPFIIKVNHHSEEFRGQTTAQPMQTITSKNGWGVVSPYIARIGQTGYGGDRMQYPVEKPLTTVTSKAEHLLVAPVIDRQFSRSTANRADAPLGTVTTAAGGKSNLVTAFLAQYHSETGSHDARGQTLNRPILTVDAANRYGLVSSNLIKLRGTCAHGQPVTEPMPTITAGGFHVGEVRAFLLKYYGASDNGQRMDEPVHTVTTKDRFGLVTVEGEDYQIVDIGMRMLEPRELFAAQGFPQDYIIDHDHTGKRYPKSAQVARCGNAVPPAFAKALVEANLPEMCAQFGDVASD